MTIPTLIAPQLRTATGRVNDPARRDRGPPQDAISLKSKVTKPKAGKSSKPRKTRASTARPSRKKTKQ